MTQPGTPIQTPDRDGEAPAPERAPRVRRAYKAMEARGPGHLSLRDVAEEARERKAVLPHHFESKENPSLPAVRWMPARRPAHPRCRLPGRWEGTGDGGRRRRRTGVQPRVPSGVLRLARPRDRQRPLRRRSVISHRCATDSTPSSPGSGREKGPSTRAGTRASTVVRPRGRAHPGCTGRGREKAPRGVPRSTSARCWPV